MSTQPGLLQKNILKPHLKQQWVIPPDASAAFVANMEDVLEVYQRSHDPPRPLKAPSPLPRSRRAGREVGMSSPAEGGRGRRLGRLGLGGPGPHAVEPPQRRQENPRPRSQRMAGPGPTGNSKPPTPASSSR